MKYTKKQNNERYRLHFQCRKRNIGIDVKHKTCNLLHDADMEKCIQKLVKEYNYVIQRVLYVSDKRTKANKLKK